MRNNIVCLNYIWAFKIKTLRQRTTACKQYCPAAGATQGNIACTQTVIFNLIEMTERKIAYKTNDQSEYITYIDIGSCEKHYDFLPLYDESKTSYNDWHRDFKLYSIGEQILTLHYYLLQYNSGSYVPNELIKRISKYIDILNEFNSRWFDPSAPFFNSLDLNWEDIEDDVLKVKENDEGIRKEIEFNNGSSIRFLDNDDEIQSFYVTEKEYEELKISINLILEKLK